MNQKFTVAGVSGSLRKASLNTLYLNSLKLVCPEHIEFNIYPDLAELPPFNVDHDDDPPESVLKWKSFLINANMIVLATPEYAHGVSGVLKNALDWLVSDFRLMESIVAFPNVSMRATIAQSHMKEVLRTMDHRIVESCSPCASVDGPFIHPELSAQENAEHPVLGPRLVAFWQSVNRYLTEQAAQTATVSGS